MWKTHSDLSDEWLVKIMLTNVINVSPDISQAMITKGLEVMLLFNEKTKKMKERLLEDTYYTPNASINIISLDYMQKQGKF
ncbi:hypothetical protein ATCC90586_004523 [Pythium insidiosum]|nr:hypothetical protein ATCC90586_004523 [Pythium insidiosum]